MNIDMRSLDTKISRGDYLSDEELRVALARFRNIQELLQDLGPRWDFAWKEALRIANTCDKYLTARARYAEERDRKGK